VVIAVPATALAWPKPAVTPVSWEFRFRFDQPKKISVFLPGESEPTVYWYMLYEVENPTGQEIRFLPSFELVTDTLQVVESESMVSPEAFNQVKRMANNPFLLPPEKILGPLQQGRDRARYGVAIFRDFDPKAKEFTIFVGGLSGEWTRVKNPAFNEDKPDSEQNRRYFVLHKTLALPYRLPGSELQRPGAEAERLPEKQKWVMR
jgi:hypothetical protein